MCSLHLTHPITRSLVLGAVGSYCRAPGEQWECGGWGGVRCLAQGHHGRAGGEVGPLQVAVHTPNVGLFRDLNRQPYSSQSKPLLTEWIDCLLKPFTKHQYSFIHCDSIHCMFVSPYDFGLLFLFLSLGRHTSVLIYWNWGCFKLSIPSQMCYMI